MLRKTFLVYCVYIIADSSAKFVEKPKSNQLQHHQHHHHHHHHAPEARFITSFPQTQKQAEIVHYEYKYLPENGYSLYYETTDGQMRYEYGYFKDDENFSKTLNVRGFYGYYDENGKRYFTRYSANEKGYQYENGEPYFDSINGALPTVENTIFGDQKKRSRNMNEQK